MKDLPKFSRGSGYLESLVEKVDRILQFRDGSRVLYIDRMNTLGQLVYVNIQIPLFFQERLRALFLYLLVIPAVIAFIIKIVVRIALYYKYRGWEMWSEQTAIFVDPPKPVGLDSPIFTRDELKNIDFHLPPLDRGVMERIVNEHKLLRKIGSKLELNRRGVSVKSKINDSDILKEEDDIFFKHPDFTRLEFESMGETKINNEVGYSAQEWANLHVLDYLALQREELAELRGSRNAKTITIRRIRTEPLDQHVLIIREC
ncbi:hypothetical protein O1W69_05030 [Chlamydia sp. 12-01]|uniref:hypothetical protein n=1 Tax=Chlamydia sp. 12-01 TaxID=3002742 RepID=UPI0035D41DB7